MSEDKRLADYLLGNLPEPEQVRLEEEYLTNPDTQSRLLIVEDELVDAYLQGQLSAQEQKQLESRFLASPRGRRKLELARSLMSLASAQKLALVQRPSPSPRFSMRWAFAAAAAVLLFVLGWSIRQKIGRPATESAGNQQTKTDHQAPAASAGLKPTPTPVESPAQHPQPAVMAAIILRPVSRNMEQASRVKIPRSAFEVKIQLDLEADNHQSYKVTLLGAGDDVKWSGSALKSQPVASGRAVVLKLPAALFEKGEYTFLLSPEEDATRPIAEYTLTVQKN